jgi:hypothetical protein
MKLSLAEAIEATQSIVNAARIFGMDRGIIRGTGISSGRCDVKHKKVGKAFCDIAHAPADHSNR